MNILIFITFIYFVLRHICPSYNHGYQDIASAFGSIHILAVFKLFFKNAEVFGKGFNLLYRPYCKLQTKNCKLHFRIVNFWCQCRNSQLLQSYCLCSVPVVLTLPNAATLLYSSSWCDPQPQNDFHCYFIATILVLLWILM